MNTQEMINKAHELARQRPGYWYNPQILEEIINTGLPEGELATMAGGQKVIRKGGEVIYITDNKKKSVPLTREIEEKLLIAYAVKQSALSTTMGSL